MEKRKPKEMLVANSGQWLSPAFWNLQENLIQWDEFIPVEATAFNISFQQRCFHE